MKVWKRLFTLIVVGMLVISILPTNVVASEAGDEEMMPEATNNSSLYTYSSYPYRTVISYLLNTDSGIMRVEYTGTAVVIEYYDQDYNILSQKYLSRELSLFGGFYEGSDSYYLV